MAECTTVRVGTRKSQLAMIQTTWVVNELKKLNKNLNIEVIQMSTIGDQILNKSLSKTGEKSLFTKELEEALIAHKVDMVVNSLKDMPSTLPPNLTISAVSKREDPRDAVIMHPNNKGKTLSDLEAGSTIGTSALRRVAQLTKLYPHLKFQSIRGNLNTRLHKLDETGIFSAIVLAVAGVKRMGWEDRISQILTPEECLYAVGQGALGIETRLDDIYNIQLVSQLHHRDTVIMTVCERAFLKTLGGGCSVPQAVHSWIKDNNLYLRAGVYNLDGTRSLVDEMHVSLEFDEKYQAMVQDVDPDKCTEFSCITTTHKFMNQLILKAAGHLGRDLALDLLKRGAKDILDEARKQDLARPDQSI
ncbi:porphobilinogen deaminase-like [Clavelina lepadiformis]|uniref:hydroxymethylbilane synthase n=1 Tax=Clavelina lepadiformis TaxID=159417 RepID=A0ABP0GLX5_CLALP